MQKSSVEVEHKKRTTKPIHGFIEHLAFGDDLEAPKKKDFANWQSIGNYMQAARPGALDTAKVFSGPVSSSKLVNQVERHQDWDTAYEKATGERDHMAMAYGMIPDNYYEQMPASYHPHANSVILNEKSPGALIHELGHGVDMGRRGDEKFKRWLRWNYKPELMSEFDAWRKGRKAYQEGFAASPESEKEKSLKEYEDNMESYNRSKYPAYGSYLGSTLGAVGGAVGGGVLGYNLASGRDDWAKTKATLGGGLLGLFGGGITGGIGGTLAGKGWGSFRSGANKKKALKQLENAKSNPKIQEIRDRLAKITSKKKKKKKSKKK
jgi:hypothetical protein